MSKKAGLLSQTEKGYSLIPLQSVKVQGELIDFCAKVEITQTYINQEDNPIEATYIFPLDENAAVCGFECEIDGKKLIAEVKENEKAKETYDDAIASGKGAYMLEKIDDETFQVSVGNLPPKKEVTIKIVFVAELTNLLNDNCIHFRLPTTVAPSGGSTEFKLSVDLNISTHSKIDSIKSTSHKIKSSINKKAANVSLVNKESLNKDLEVDIYLEEPHQPRAWIELPKESTSEETAAMLCFFPDMKNQETQCEIIFLLDRSGSMGGAPISDVSKTMTLAINSLPENTLFNIVGFGSAHESLFTESVVCEGSNKSTALKHVAGLAANLGGTNLLSPLKFIYGSPTKKQTPRLIFLLTDGEVGNNDECVDVVKKSADTTRCFTFGIGENVDAKLVKSVAKAGKGFCEFVNASTSSESMQTIVLRQIKRAVQPALTEVKMEWKGIETSNIRQAPTKLPPIFNQERYIIYAFINSSMKKKCEIVLTANSPNEGSVSFKLELDPSKAVASDIVHRLGARSLIAELETGERGDILGKEKAKEEIVSLGVKYSLASKHTSFICVEKRDTPVIETMEQRNIPTNNKRKSSGGGGGYSGGGGATATRSKTSLADISRGLVKKQKTKESYIDTPFGFKAEIAPKGVSDPYLEFVFMGPKNSRYGKDCWLNAILALVMTIAPVRDYLSKSFKSFKKQSFLRALGIFINTWKYGDQSSIVFRKELNSAHDEVWKHFQSRGFAFGFNHEIKTALLVILHEVAPYMPSTTWKIVYLHQPIENMSEDYLIFFNELHSPILSTFTVPGYKLHSYIFYEHLGYIENEEINHFTTYTIFEKGLAVFDDLLLLKPHGYQGGFISTGNVCYERNLRGSQEKSPIFIFKRENL